MEIWFGFMEKSWKIPGNPLVNMCMNPDYYINSSDLNLTPQIHVSKYAVTLLLCLFSRTHCYCYHYYYYYYYF